MKLMNLKEWAEAYIKYKDTVQRKISSINNTPEGITVKQKTGEEIKYLCIENLQGTSTDNIKEKRVVCLNTKKNLEWLHDNWETARKNKAIFLFVNPEKAENWAINPYLHGNVTDKKSLKQGLKALFESITEAQG